MFLEAIEEQDDVTLTEADRAYLKALETWLDMCPEMRTTWPESRSLAHSDESSGRVVRRA